MQRTVWRWSAILLDETRIMFNFFWKIDFSGSDEENIFPSMGLDETMENAMENLLNVITASVICSEISALTNGTKNPGKHIAASKLNRS